MITDTIKQLLIQNPERSFFVILGAVIVFLVLVIKNKINSEFIKEKLIEKHNKTIAANLVLIELNTNSEKIGKLVKEMEVVEMFDVDDAYAVLKHLHNIEKAHKKAEILNKKDFTNDLFNLIKNVYIVIMDIVRLENESYEKTKKYEELKVYYSRELQTLKQLPYSGEKVKTMEKKISQELKSYTKDLNKLNSEYIKERKDLYEKLLSIKKVNDLLIKELFEIKSKEIEPKKFYLNRLSYI